jgi:hypothetical protein
MASLFVVDLGRCVLFYVYVGLNSSFNKSSNQAVASATTVVSVIIFLATLLARRLYMWNPATFDFIPTAPPVAQWYTENQQPIAEPENPDHREDEEAIEG